MARLTAPKPRLLAPPPPAARAARPPTVTHLIDRLDEAYCDGEFGRLLGRDSRDPAARLRSLALFGELAAALFPDEYLSPEDALAARPGLYPRLAAA